MDFLYDQLSLRVKNAVSPTDEECTLQQIGNYKPTAYRNNMRDNNDNTNHTRTTVATYGYYAWFEIHSTYSQYTTTNIVLD